MSVLQSYDALKSNLLRASITIIIIAIGITALVGVLTSIDGIKNALGNSFSTLGTNTFQIKNRSSATRVRGRRVREYFPPITFTQARLFKKDFTSLYPVSISAQGNFAATIRYRSQTTNANINILGTDENYLSTARLTIAEGRSLSSEDVGLSRQVIVLGNEVKETLFPKESAVGKNVTVDGKYYKVIGTFEEMGSMGSMGGDKICIIPVSTLRSDYPNPHRSFTLNVYVEKAEELETSMENALGRFRLVRKLSVREENNFSVTKSDAFVGELMENLKVLTLSATLIAFITLLGASIALLNVMLVSVTERTREIGVRKAMGATKRSILVQFLSEAIIICQIGGVLGVLIGLSLGNILSKFIMKAGFVAPWGWMIAGLVACFVVGVLSGAYPAWKAAKVDPIESLRHE